MNIIKLNSTLLYIIKTAIDYYNLVIITFFNVIIVSYLSKKSIILPKVTFYGKFFFKKNLYYICFYYIFFDFSSFANGLNLLIAHFLYFDNHFVQNFHLK